MAARIVLALWVVAMLSFGSGGDAVGARAGSGGGGDDVAALRAEGPPALDRLFARRDALTQRRADEPPAARAGIDRDIAALDSVIDQVGGQRYCAASRLFWHTDFEKALAAARSSGKPILSLRMMGKLTDEYSCANSRFFRATLYVNRAVSKVMRERFVLHWASVRPVPQLTIDYGDGRKLRRTLTGNSIHYVMDKDGRVIDGLPGLYSPQRFEQWLTQTATMAVAIAGLPQREAVAPAALNRSHVWALSQIARQWEADLERIRTRPVPGGVAQGGHPSAEAAGERAVSKSRGEMPVLPNVTMRLAQIGGRPGANAWNEIGALHVDEVSFDEDTIAFIRTLNPVAGRDAADTGLAFGELLLQLQSAVAADTVRNEYDLHRRIHEWLAQAPNGIDIETLNERVYDELFLTPRSDPWIGMLPADAFTALADNGVETPR